MLSGSGTLASGQISDHLLLVAGFNAWHSAPNKREAARLAKQYCLDVKVLFTELIDLLLYIKSAL